MGQIITKLYRPVDLGKFDLSAYARAWLVLLIEAGILKPTSTGDDVLIVEMPAQTEAKSAYGAVVTIGWSANNGDFTEESRTMDLAKLKPVVARIARERNIARFFPSLIGVPMGFNVWLQRYDAAFCVVPA